MDERVVSGFPLGSVNALRGKLIAKARAERDHNGNVESLVLMFTDGTELAIDPEVDGDRIMVSLIDG